MLNNIIIICIALIVEGNDIKTGNETDNYSIELLETFNYCYGYKKSSIIDIIDTESTCKLPGVLHFDKEMYYKKDDIKYFHAIILNKNNHEIYGTGFECEQEDLTYKFSKTWFFGDETMEIEKKRHYLSMEECWKMVSDKRCIGYQKNDASKKMKCQNDICFYDFIPKSEYSRGSTIVKTIIQCQFKKRLVESENKSLPLFKSDNGCMYKDKYCDLQRSIVVWNSSVLHECPFEFVSNIDLERIDKNMFFSETKGLFFKISDQELLKDKIQQCSEFHSYKTEEGVYLTFVNEYKQKIKNFTAYNEDSIFIEDYSKVKKCLDPLDKINGLINIKEYLEVSQSDYVKFLFMMMNNMQRSNFCKTVLQFLQDSTTDNNNQDNFLIIKNEVGNETVLFRHNSLIFEANCELISNIQVPVKMEKCFENIPVTFEQKGNLVNAFFDEKLRIIKPFTKIDETQLFNEKTPDSDKCNGNRAKYIKIGSRFFIQIDKDIRLLSEDSLSNLKKKKLQTLLFSNLNSILNIEKDPFEHLRIMSENIDLSKGLGFTSEEKDIFSKDNLIDSESDRTELKTGFSEFVSKAHNSISYFANSIAKALGMGVIGILVILLMGIVILYCVKYGIRKFHNKKPKQKDQRIESEPLDNGIPLKALDINDF